jgi:hypothetical protein
MNYELKKDSLLARFVFWVWNVSERDFSYVCPFFWLTMFTIIFSPVIVIIKLLGYQWKRASKSITIYYEQKESNFKAWADVYYRSISQDEKQMNTFINDFYKNTSSQMFKFYEEYLYRLDSSLYIKCQNIYLDYLEAKNDEKENKLMERRKMITKIVLITKPITKIVLYTLSITVAIFLCYFVYIGIVYLMSLPSGVLSNWLISALVIIICISIIIFSLIILCKRTKVLNHIVEFFIRIGDLYEGVIDFISIFFEKNCPPIKWK